MEYTPISPFMRPISHAHLRVIEAPEASVQGKPINKWELLRELSKAQAAFGVTERDLTVLQGLLSFFPNDALGGNAEMIVFPSNKAICERLNGMPCSTMRRHLARLVETGLLVRRDSPNGKRYVRKRGADHVAFGFDLSPLYCRSEEIARAAEAVREAEERVRRLREVVSLMRRDLAALAEFGEELQPGLGLWDQMRDAAALTARALRRKLSLDDLGRYQAKLEAFLDTARNFIDGPETEEMITNDAQNERHYHNSNKECIEIEPGLKEAEGIALDCEPDTCEESSEASNLRQVPKIPLHLVVRSCPALKTFYAGEIRHWHQLYDAASHVRPAMGICVSAWEEAQRCMGPEQASVVVAAILERFAEIRSPGGYLRALSAKAVAGEFSCGPMIMALIGKQSAA
ncbi:replication initiation protein RepC (plasmid) [Leisingera aquaemixtae]|uniref:Replication initiation protein RepC n=1 Tax=Leisingera aquaemixtae TaxID=1396826 RepID=A0ABY5WRT0_9RHOB|nr:plasmid replication protein RepC [Leisingera aquaemixtae]UWQ44061.1 replication initiation protein RepC [Leisingera aquaemixtae]